MKKLITIILLNLFCCNIVLSETLTYNCKKLLGYVDDEWKYVTHYSDETVTLIWDKKTYDDEWGTIVCGSTSLIYKQRKRDFTVSCPSSVGFEAYDYDKINNEDIKKHKELKKHKGKIDYMSFLKLEQDSINQNYYNLYYVPAGGMWTLETSINQINFNVYQFICKIS